MGTFYDLRRTIISAAVSCALIVALSRDAQAQRVIFPTPTDPTTPVYTTQATTPTFTTPTYTSPSFTTPQYGNPVLPYNGAPSYTYPQTAPTSPAFDPYGGAPPSTLAPAPYNSGAPAANDGFFPSAIRLLQEARFESTYIARTGNQGTANSFGIMDDNLYASFGFPVPRSDAPLLITPGFNFHFLDGPNSTGMTNTDLPPQVYDAYLATSWRPQVSQRFAADLAFSIGVYSDFKFVDSHSLRILGRGIGIYSVTPNWSAALGVVYLDRLSVKLLPAGGIIWTPNPDARYEILFPNPKLSQRITTYGNTDFWAYLRGEYGGGQWTVQHITGQEDTVNYNDLRLIIGVDWFNMRRMHGNFEVGYVFNRQILYLASAPTVNPSDSVMLRAGLSY